MAQTRSAPRNRAATRIAPMVAVANQQSGESRTSISFMNTGIENSAQANESAPGGDGNSPLLRRNGGTREACAHCWAKIVDGHWFCRLPQNGNREVHAEGLAILLCSPRCALRYFEALRRRDNDFISDYEQHQHSVHFLVDGEKPA